MIVVARHGTGLLVQIRITVAIVASGSIVVAMDTLLPGTFVEGQVDLIGTWGCRSQRYY